jgi:dipeptidyl aminopeptidase/acylaminoacyl peptidase
VTRNDRPVGLPSATERDLRGTPLWAEVEQFYLRSREDRFKEISSVADPVLSPDGGAIAFTGSGQDALDQPSWQRVYLLDRASGEVRAVSADRARRPQWSASGRWLAFLAGEPAPETGDEVAALCYLEVATGRLAGSGLRPASGIDGFTWSRTADRVLAWSAERRPELGPVRRHQEAAWLPAVRATFASPAQAVFTEAPGEPPETGCAPDGLWIWEAAWAGPRAYLALASEHAEPPDWYRARLVLVETATGAHEELHRPPLQAGRLAASPDGGAAIWVEALASDRGMIAGTVITLDLTSRALRRAAVPGTDVCDLRWRDETTIGYLGVSGSATTGGNLDLVTLAATQTWSTAGTCGMPLPSGDPAGAGSFVVAYEDWRTEPELRVVGRADAGSLGVPRRGTGAAWERARKGAMTEVSWTSLDGLEIAGLLITPEQGEPPYPLVVNVHGGPVWAWRNNWDIVFHTPVALLASRGFAVLNPNGRGSVGRGPEFTGAIRHAMGGADTGDYVSAARAMTQRGIAAPGKVSVIGHSYGGFMACCLAASGAFDAAVAISPCCDWVSQHYVSAIPGFDRFFVADPADGAVPRGPVELAARVRTPTLVIGCEDDDCTPAGQAIEFYRAIAEHGGADAALAVYPDERHGITGWPALLDQSVRITAWLERYAR